MNTRFLQIKALDKKLNAVKTLVPVIPLRQSWIKTLREALGMTALQLANRIGITQARVARMEANEQNLKLSTLAKVAQSMDCTFIPLFVPNKSLEETVRLQAQKKAKQMLESVNQNMALENQLADSEDILSDITEELLSKNTKRIWEE